MLIESEIILHCDLLVYINHPEKLREDIKVRFGDSDYMHVLELIVTSIDM